MINTFEDGEFLITHDPCPVFRSVYIQSNLGLLFAHSEPNNSLCIDIFRASPGHKAGRALLERIIPEARNLGHDTISAHLVTREGLEAVKHVFGHDSVVIEREGDWGQRFGSTEASLNYQIPENIQTID